MDILSKSSSCLRRSFLYSSISNVRREDNISGNRFKQMSADECGGFDKKLHGSTLVAWLPAEYCTSQTTNGNLCFDHTASK